MQFKNKAFLALKVLLISLGLTTNLYAQCQIRELSTPRNSKASMVIPCAGYLTHITPDDEVGTTIERKGIVHVGYLCNQVEANSELGRLGFPMSARSCSTIPQSTQNGFACNPDDDSLIARQGNADEQCRNLDNVRVPVRSGDVVTLWRSASANLRGNPSVIFTPYKAPGQSNIPQCSDTQDNDNDGTTDFYEESGLAGSFTFASCAEIRTFLNSFPELSKISEDYYSLGCARSDTATRNEICRRAGYKRVVSYKTGHWASCHDNQIGKWDASANDIVIQNACVAGNINLNQLVCDTRVTECSDGKDNDGDGKIDLNDSGCQNALDLSEKSHDQDCDSPTDNTEKNGGSSSTPQCRDSNDNDNDGKIDNFDPGCWANPNDPSTYDNDRNDESADNNLTLGQPVITVPANNSTVVGNTKPTISWNAVAGADYYDIWGRLISDTGVTITDQIFRDQHVSGTSFQPTANLAFGKYRVWVRAYKNSGTFSVWSAPVTFSLIPAIDHTQCNDNVDNDNDGKKDAADPGCWDDQNNSATYNQNLNNEAADYQAVLSKPVVTYPINGSTISSGNKRPEFRWTSVVGANYYDLWVDEISFNATTTVRSQVIRQKNLSTTSFTPSEDLTNGKYRVWVQAYRNSGSPKGSGWSLASTFILANGTSAKQCNDGIDNDGDGKIDFAGGSGCRNLIVNGDFESGNSAFSSGYNYNNLSSCINSDSLIPAIGQYSIVLNPNRCHRAWDVLGSSKIAIFNGSNSNSKFWCQTVPVQANINYLFSVDEKLLHQDGGLNSNYGSAPLSWTIAGQTLLAKQNALRNWNTRTANWNSGSNTSVEICGINHSGNNSGNDWAIDNISLRISGGSQQCSLPDPDCSSEDDDSESPDYTTQCNDGLDNDGDQKIDSLDPGCWNNRNDSSTYNANLNDESADNSTGTLAQPVITSPTKGQVTSDKTPTFKWNSVSGANYYDLWVRRLDLSSDTIITDQIIRNQHVVGTSYTSNTNLPGGRYTVWVRAYSNSGASSIWSMGIMFVISDPSNPQCSDGSDNDGDGVIDEKDPGCWRDHRDPWSYHPGCDDEDSEPVKVAYLVEPVNNLSTNNPRPWFSWDTVQGAEKYQIWINNFPLTGAQTSYLIVDGITSINYMTATNIPVGRYKVWVRGYTGDISAGTGTRGAWSLPRTFTITASSGGGGGTGSNPQCNDGIDNDNDGVTDTDDPGCYGDPNGADESAATTECQDGIDNDGDQKVDGADPQCLFNTDNSESN